MTRLRDRLVWSRAELEARGDGVATREVMARAAIYLYVAGATIGLVAFLLPQPAGYDEIGILATIASAYGAAGVVLALFDRRLPPWSFQALVALATVLISLAIYFSGNGGSAYAFFYLWAALYAFYFTGPLAGAAQTTLIGVAYAAVLAAREVPSPAERWILTLGTVALLGLLISLLRERILDLIGRLSDAARTDPMTGLFNRRAFEEAFDSELERARRVERDLSVLVADIDHFKQVNDSFGHGTGDLVLQEAAAVLRDGGRRMDTAARIGGEEFALLMPESKGREGYVAAERLRGAVRDRLRRRDVPVTLSIGVASFPRDGATQADLLEAADRALYAAKQLGRDRSVLYSREIDELLRGDESWPLRPEGGHLATALGLADALDARGGDLPRHSETVGRYAAAIARELALPPERAERVRLAGVLHDIGKVVMPDAMLRNPGPFEEEESVELRSHPTIGARLLAGDELADLRAWIVAHHERPDGDGFPAGLTAERIPLEASILAVADAYEAMTAARAGDHAVDHETAREALRREAGTRFDERVVEAFLGVLGRGGEALVRD